MGTDDRNLDGPEIRAAPLDLGAEWTIAQAAQHREHLLDRLGDGRRELVLDLSRVAEFDSAGVQLLLATARTLAERQGALRLAAPSTVVRDALAVLGLQDRFAAA